jgi:DNA processing protein
MIFIKIIRGFLRAWLAFSFVPKLGGKKLSRFASVASLAHLINYSERELIALGLVQEQIRYLRETAPQEVEECLSWQQANESHHILTLFCDGYPSLLKEIATAPPVLFVKGRITALSDPQMAIVGSRNASPDGQRVAHQFAREFVQQGLVVTSGLALGIDGHAHDGALQAGGETIAVLGSGLESIYPARHQKLAQRVMESGALVSEFRPKAKPRPDNFPRRNRIISGLAVGVLVVEAAEKSGSLITARYAAEQGRDVFVIPGSIANPNCHGSNQLIRSGACLVQNSEQVLSEIGTLVDWSLRQKQPQPDLFSVQSDQQLPFAELLANVGVEATPVDILASRTHIPVHEVMMQLLELELSGHVVAVSGGYIRKGKG